MMFKESRVVGPVKRYRRLLSNLEQGGFDYHGTGNLDAVAEAGAIAPGHRNTFGAGVYHTQDVPAMEYWKTTRAHGPREGGVINPRGVTQSAPASLFREGPGAYRTSPTVPLGPHSTIVASDAIPGAVDALRKAQLNHRVRPAFLPELEAAMTVHRGGASVATGARLARRRTVVPNFGPPSLYNSILGSGERAFFGARNLLSNAALTAKGLLTKHAINIAPFNHDWKNNLLMATMLGVGTPSIKRPLATQPSFVHAVQLMGEIRKQKRQIATAAHTGLLPLDVRNHIVDKARGAVFQRYGLTGLTNV